MYRNHNNNNKLKENNNTTNNNNDVANKDNSNDRDLMKDSGWQLWFEFSWCLN